MYLALTSTILLVSVNFQYQTAYCQGCTRGFANLNRLQFGDNGRNGRQYIFPGITFTCHGNITRWIFYGNWINNNGGFPEFQIWRNSSSQGYVKVGSTAVSYDERPNQNSNRYEYPLGKHEEVPFQPGDILGIYAPRASQSHLRQRYEQGTDVEMSFFRNVENPMDTFRTSGSGIRSVTTDLPMITVEVEVSVTNTPHNQPSPVVPHRSGVVPTSSSLLSSCKSISAITVSSASPNVCQGAQERGGIRNIAIYGGVAGGAVLVLVISVIALTAVLMIMSKNHKRTPILYNATSDSRVISAVQFNGSGYSEDQHSDYYESGYDTPMVKNPAYRAISQEQITLPEYEQIHDDHHDEVNGYANDY